LWAGCGIFALSRKVINIKLKYYVWDSAGSGMLEPGAPIAQGGAISMTTETEAQGSMTQTIIWLAAMLVGVAVVAYFLV
jgi:hypothetical protein